MSDYKLRVAFDSKLDKYSHDFQPNYILIINDHVVPQLFLDEKKKKKKASNDLPNLRRKNKRGNNNI